MAGRDPDDQPDRDAPPESASDPAIEPARADPAAVDAAVWGGPEWDDLPRRSGGGRRGKGGPAAGRRAALQLVDRLRWTRWALVYRAAGLSPAPGGDPTPPAVGRQVGDAPSVPEPTVPAATPADARRARRDRVKRRSKRDRLGGDNGAAPVFVGPAGFPTGGPTAALARRLANLPVGLYAVHLDAVAFESPATSGAKVGDEKGERPSAAAAARVRHLVPVTDALIATSLRRLSEARRFPNWLPKLVGDVPAWRAAAERQLALARRAADAAAELADQPNSAGSSSSDVSALVLEASCLWLGPDGDRPSARLSTDVLSAHLLASPPQAVPTRSSPADRNSLALTGARLADEAAAVLLGLRGVSRSLPAGLERWRACGATLRCWPVDLLMTAGRRLGSLERLMGSSAESTWADEPAARPVAWAALLAGDVGADRGGTSNDSAGTDGPPREPLADALRVLPLALAAADRIRQEVDRRFGQLAVACRSAVDAAVNASGWRPGGATGTARFRQEVVFAGVYHGLAADAARSAADGQHDPGDNGPGDDSPTAAGAKPIAAGRACLPVSVFAGQSADCRALCQAVIGDASALDARLPPGTRPSDARAGVWALPPTIAVDELVGRAIDPVFAAAAAWRSALDAERPARVSALVARLLQAAPPDGADDVDAADDVAGRAFAAWVDVCCAGTRPGRFGRGHWSLVIRGFTALAAAAPRAGDPKRYWQALAAQAGDVLAATAGRLGLVASRSQWPGPWSLARAGIALAAVVRAELPASEVAAALRGRWAHLLVRLAGATPDRTRRTLDWLGRLSGDHDADGGLSGGNWYNRPDRWLIRPDWSGSALAAVDRWLFDRLTVLAAPPRLSPAKASRAAEAIFEFLSESKGCGEDGLYAAVDRATLLARQRFLRGHPYLLDPLLGRPSDPSPDAANAARPLLSPSAWSSLIDVAWAWHEGGWPGLADLWRELLARHHRPPRRPTPAGADADPAPAGGAEAAQPPAYRPPPFDYVDDADRRMDLLRLAGGDVGRAMVLADANPDLVYRQLEAATRAARWVAKDASLAAALAPLAGTPATVNRLLRWLARLELCLRLPDAGTTAAALRELASVVTGSRNTTAMANLGAMGCGTPLPVSSTTPRTGSGVPQPMAPKLGDPPRHDAGEGDGPQCGPYELPADVATGLAAVAALNGGELPKRLRQLVGRESQLRAELRAIDRRVPPSDVAADPEVGVPSSLARRRANLAQYLADPAELAAWVAADLRKALPPVLNELVLSAAERTTESAVARHLARLLGPATAAAAVGADWDNAVRLYFSVRENRSLLLRLIRHRAAGDVGWIERYPRNANFLARLAGLGVDVAAWRGWFRKTFRTPAGRLAVELEADPLHVLQMGNYFGTCLGEHGVNAFSTVANACEANRRVAYVRDARGKVVGRKLLVLTPGGRIAGFQSYGSGRHEVLGEFYEPDDDDGQAAAAAVAGDVLAAHAAVPAKPPAGRGPLPAASPWVKVALEAFCRELSDRCRAPLHPFPDEVADDSVDEGESLKLFAKWYHDGCESFDRWWVRHAGSELRSAARAGVGPVADAVVADLRAIAVADGATRPPYADRERFAEAVRLVLWLGDDAVPLLRRVRAAGALPRPLVAALDRYAVGVDVRTWAAGNGLHQGTTH